MRLTHIVAMLFAVACATPALAQQRCMVTDPTGTPLNIRAEPNGPIIGALHNGVNVRQLQTETDSRGNSWSLIEPQAGGKTGWVFREFVSCY
jgi:hypothetical protein